MAVGPIFRSILRSPAGAILIGLQIALTLAIVSNALFIIQDRIEKMARPTGLPEEQILTARMLYFGKNIDYAAQAEEDLQFIRNLPGVINATQVNSIPLGQGGSNSTLCYVPSGNGDDECPSSSAIYNGGYHLLDTLGLSISSGRGFRPEEVTGSGFNISDASTIIVTRALADRYFPNGDALGKTLYSAKNPLTIIGIVDRLQSPFVTGDEEAAEYSSIMPINSHEFFTLLMIRAEADAILGIQRDLEANLIKLNDRRVIDRINTMQETRQRVYGDDLAMLVLLTSVIILLVLITALGTGGLVSFTVASRQKQIGTRRALGARKVDILSYFLVENGLICSVGIIIGIALAVGLNQYLMQTYELQRLTLEYIGITMGLLFLVSQGASYLPALKAASISPALATRTV